jgi:signal transduction histidine kinase
MSAPLIITEVRSEADVVSARQMAKQIAALMQFDLHEQTRIATAVSEIARNAYLYAGGARVQFSVEGQATQTFAIRITDRGPGIPNLQAILDGTEPSKTGMGVGLIGAKRLMDVFQVHSSNRGTTIELGKTVPAHLPPVTAETVARITAELDKRSPTSLLDEIRQQNLELLRALDGLRTRQLELDRMYREVSEANVRIAAANIELEDQTSALQTSEARFRAIFETAEVSIWDEDFSAVRRLLEELRAEHGGDLRQVLTTNPHLVEQALSLVRVRDVNPATVRMFGASDKQQLMDSFQRLFLPETRAVFVEQLIALSAGKPAFVGETPLRTLNGERLEVATTVVFHAAGNGEFRAYVTLMDISARKSAERERETRVREVERALQFSEMFVGILGHDLRNPLNAISLSASLLELKADSDGLRHPLGKIITSAERMSRMITQLLDFTRMRLGEGIPLELTRIDLAEVARSIIDELEPVHRRPIRLETRGDIIGTWDGDRLSQLLSNLAANACQHGTNEADVLIELDGTLRDKVHIVVRNRGVIPAQLLPLIFTPLKSRGGQQSRDGSSGLGLGLYITEQIVRAHGGDIGVESTAEVGTRFSIRLPRRQTGESVPPAAFGMDPL